MEPLAKPSGISLADHRQHVLEEAERLLGLRHDRPAVTSGLPFLAKKYRQRTGADLAQRVRRAAWLHDEGKKHERWQGACQKDYTTYRAWRAARSLNLDGVDATDYKRFEADKTWRHQGSRLGAHLMKAKLRHEFDSLRRCNADGLDLSLAERVAIAAHHGKLSAKPYAVKRWLTDGDGAFAGLWRGLQKADVNAARDFRGRDLTAPVQRRYELAGVRALLRLADTRASRAEAGDALAPIVPFHYTWPHPERRDVQDLALKHADRPVTVLRAPTGSGKTGAALLWGQHQVENRRADRVVIAMPTRFTANALAIDAEDDIAHTGLYHSSAWFARFDDTRHGTPEHDLAQERHALARLLATPLSVCTVDHLLLALTGTREDHHATFFFLANAAVVFDEVDFYDAFVQANLAVLLDALRALDVRVLLMSATVPDSARRFYGVPDEVRETKEGSSGTRWLHRHHSAVETPEDAGDVLDRMLAAGTGIVYANTVERAYRYWKYLRERADDLPVFLYHSRFTEPDKKQVEQGVIGALGQTAWEEKRARGIAVLTQIGEMSINVSAPLMLSDLCPWDRLAQRAGRLARFQEAISEGHLYVADPHRDGALYPAPYGAFVRGKGWEVGEPLRKTQRRLNEHVSDGPFLLTADLLVREVDALYPEPELPDVRTRANTHQLGEMMRQNWMIVSATDAREDEADVQGKWRSREIPPQTTLLILPEDLEPKDNKPLAIPGYNAWRRIEAEHGISVPHYLLERARKRGWVSSLTYTIGDDPEEHCTYWCVKGYDAPDEAGVGGGLGELAVREREDSFSDVHL